MKHFRHIGIFLVAALLVAIYLKALDSKKHLGLEEPNIKEEKEVAAKKAE